MIELKRVVVAALMVGLLAGCGAESSKERYVNRGLALYEAGDLVKAKLEFRNALQIDGKDAQAWFMLGQIEEQQQNWRQAFGAYSRAVEFDAGHARARVKRGLLLLASGEIADAMADAEAVLALDAQSLDALVLRAAARQREGTTALALADIDAVLAIEPKHREALAVLSQIRLGQGDSLAAIATLETALEAHPQDIQLWLMLGGVYEQTGETDKATDTLRRIVELEPEVVAHRQRLGGYLAQRGLHDEAMTEFREAVRLAPDDFAAKLSLVQYIGARQSIAAAKAELEQMIAAAPQEYRLRFTLAELLASEGDTEAARATYDSVIADTGTNATGLEARWRLAMMEMAAGRDAEADALANAVLAEDARNEQALLIRGALALKREDANQAIADARTVLRNDPNALDALRLLGRGHALKGELALAQDALTSAINTAPEQPISYLELARVRVSAGDLDGALTVLESLLEQVPDNIEAQNAIAEIQLGQQDWSALEASSRRILESRPEHALGHYLRGVLLQRQGQFAASIPLFEEARTRAPEAAEPVIALARSQIALEQLDRAEATMRDWLAANPNDITASTLLARILDAAERTAEATDLYRDTIRFHPRASAAYLGLAGLQQRLNDLPGAIATLRQGVEATQRNAFLVFNLALALQQAEQAEQDREAIALYEEVLAANPGADVVANNLAMLLLDDPEATPAQLDRALQLASRFEGSDQVVLLDTLGWAQYRKGQYELAAQTFERAAAKGESLAELDYHLGMTYLALERTAEALPLLERAVASETPFPGRDEARARLAELRDSQGLP